MQCGGEQCEGERWGGGEQEMEKSRKGMRRDCVQRRGTKSGPVLHLLHTLCHRLFALPILSPSSHGSTVQPPTNIHAVALTRCTFTLCNPTLFNPPHIPVQDYMDPCEPRQGFLKNVRHMFDLSDVVEDVSEVSKASR